MMEVVLKVKKKLIAFKGVKEGIYISIKGDDFSAIKEELKIKMKNAAEFYQGTKLLGIKSEELSPEDREELKLILKYKYDLIIEDSVLPNHLESSSHDKLSQKEELAMGTNSLEDTDCGMTKFLYGTMRSGQVVEYNGNIVIVGDVNPGALIKARGNIIVLGSLKGIAHAGVQGNHEVIVAAYNLQPMQLRIGDMIARPPDEGDGSFKMPEVAKIKEGELIVEPYLPNK